MWFEPISTWFVALVTTACPWLKEKTTKAIPAENWANKELHQKDVMDGISAKEILRRAEAGRYYIPKEVFQAYPTPHRDTKDNKIVIENSVLYYEDVNQYGAYQAQQWVKQGKYNLNTEELKIAHLQIERRYQYLYSIGNSDSKYSRKVKEIDAILSTKQWDCRNTEAVRQWKRAHDAESKYY